MNYGSVLNKVLLLIPVALVAPLLAVATPACGTLTPTNPVSFTDNTFSLSHLFDATFNCTGVTFSSPAAVFGGNEAVVFTSSTQFKITSDLGPNDTDILFTGTTPDGQVIRFKVSEGGPLPGQETVSMVPEPGSMLLFGTGLLIAGGFVRRRRLAQTVA
jgi:hypothetical protein